MYERTAIENRFPCLLVVPAFNKFYDHLPVWIVPSTGLLTAVYKHLEYPAAVVGHLDVLWQMFETQHRCPGPVRYLAKHVYAFLAGLQDTDQAIGINIKYLVDRLFDSRYLPSRSCLTAVHPGLYIRPQLVEVVYQHNRVFILNGTAQSGSRLVLAVVSQSRLGSFQYPCKHLPADIAVLRIGKLLQMCIC